MYHAFPLNDRVLIIELSGPGLSLEQIAPTLLKTKILVVATQHPERERYALEELSNVSVPEKPSGALWD